MRSVRHYGWKGAGTLCGIRFKWWVAQFIDTTGYDGLVTCKRCRRCINRK